MLKSKISLLVLIFVIAQLGLYAQKTNEKNSRRKEKGNSVIYKIEERCENNILVCAHRSFHKYAPENSIQSVKDAIQAGIDIVEIDVRTTKDDSLVIMHDASIDRTTTGKGKVKELTYCQLQKFYLIKGDSVTKCKIPTLYQMLSNVEHSSVIVNLDLKDVDFGNLTKILDKFGMRHSVISYTGGLEKTMNIVSQDSMYAVMPWCSTFEDMVYFQKNTISSLLHFTATTFTPKNMRWANENKQIVFLNTLWNQDKEFVNGDNESMDKVIELHPHIIQTDYPELLIKYLRAKGVHN